MPTYRVMFGRFPQHKEEASECVDWLIETAVDISRDPRFELVGQRPFGAAGLRLSDTPITMTRNQMFEKAIELNIDILLIVDSDMAPDIGFHPDYFDPHAKRFWPTTVDFMLEHPGPCIVAAPYCGPPPVENVYVFQWTNQETDHPNSDHQIVQYTREQASIMTGIREVAALPTGLMAIDMRAIKKLKPPFTYYEWKDDKRQSEKASTEDVTFTRDLSLVGIKQYCNWDAWAGHVKRKIVGKPRPVCADMVAKKLHEGILSGRERGDRLVDIKPGERFEKEVAEALAKADANLPFAEEIVPVRQSVFAGTTVTATSATPQFQPVTPADLFR